MSSVSTQKIEATMKKDASWAMGALKKFSENRCAAMAASIAFYSVFSFTLTLVMVIAVASARCSGRKLRAGNFSIRSTA